MWETFVRERGWRTLIQLISVYSAGEAAGSRRRPDPLGRSLYLFLICARPRVGTNIATELNGCRLRDIVCLVWV